jgi:hypothetical protein
VDWTKRSQLKQGFRPGIHQYWNFSLTDHFKSLGEILCAASGYLFHSSPPLVYGLGKGYGSTYNQWFGQLSYKKLKTGTIQT